MSYLFQPPVINDQPTVPVSCSHRHHNIDPRYPHHPLACRARRHYGPNPRGRSVLKIAGTYQTIDTPTQTQIDAASEVYMGGHIYEVSDAVAAALSAAGYGLVLIPITDESGVAMVTEAGDILVIEGAL